jgi:hypothetical protein
MYFEKSAIRLVKKNFTTNKLRIDLIINLHTTHYFTKISAILDNYLGRIITISVPT